MENVSDTIFRCTDCNDEVKIGQILHTGKGKKELFCIKCAEVRQGIRDARSMRKPNTGARPPRAEANIKYRGQETAGKV